MNIYIEIFNNLNFGMLIVQYVAFLIIFVSVLFLPYVVIHILGKFQKFEDLYPYLNEKLEAFWDKFYDVIRLPGFQGLRALFIPPLLLQIIFYLLLVAFENSMICNLVKVATFDFSYFDCMDYFE